MRTPMPQSEEYYAALKMRGVPSALLQFDDEYPRHRLEAVELHPHAALHDGWYNKYTRAASGKVTTVDEP